MTPPDTGDAIDDALLTSLRAWCEGGAFPMLTERLRVARIAPRDGLDGAACELDGGHELARLSRWQGLRWRLGILWRECVSMRVARPRDPWDCGWLRAGSLGAAQAFRPRRATLLLVRDPDPEFAQSLIAVLRSNSSAFTQPMRVLIVSAAEIAGIESL